MKIIKKTLGFFWVALGLYVGYLSLVKLGIPKVVSVKQEDQIFGIIILFVLTPIIVGSLITFGLYSVRGDYNDMD